MVFSKNKGFIVMTNIHANSSDTDDMTVTTTAMRVSCNGGGGALGHPLIWLNIGEDNSVTCPYCSRHFIKIEEGS